MGRGSSDHDLPSRPLLNITALPDIDHSAASLPAASVSADYEALWTHADKLDWCALVTTGRTGTDFFQSLLDSHPEIFVFNGKLYFHDFWKSAVTVTAGEPLVAADIVDEFIGATIKDLKSRYDVFERKNELGENRDQSIDVDLALFRAHMLRLLDRRPVTSRNFLLAVYIAYALCMGEDVMQKKVFFHHQHRINRLRSFIADFPGSKIICMTRDPRANYVSGVEHWRRYDPAADNLAYPQYILSRAVDEAAELHDYPLETVRMLRLEDLGDPATLHAVAAWLGVAYDPCLTRSTWAGLRWWSDRLSTKQVQAHEVGFSPTIIANGWQLKLGRIDRLVLDYLLADILVTYGYEKQRSSGVLAALTVPFLILLPTAYERRYLAPAMLAKYLRERRLRSIVASFYHPLRRMAYHYQLLIRRYRGDQRFLPLLELPGR
jgi:hypothetical protein